MEGRIPSVESQRGGRGSREARAINIRRVWLRAWLCSALGAIVGAGLFLSATWMVWHIAGRDLGHDSVVTEISLFLRMVIGGLLGACLGAIFAVREASEVSFTLAAGGCITYFLGLQVVVMIFALAWPASHNGEAVAGLSRLAFLMVAGAVGSLAPPLAAGLFLNLRDRARVRAIARGSAPGTEGSPETGGE